MLRLFAFERLRLLTALLLAVVALQAMPARAALIEQRHGSAFDYSTVEVAIAPYTRKAETAEVRILEPPARAIFAAPAIVPTTRLAGGRAARLQPPATGPPLRRELASLVLAPRAPPHT